MALGLCAAWLVGCERKVGDQTGTSTLASASSSSNAQADAATATTAATATSATSGAPKAAGLAFTLPGRSPLPTIREWHDVGEVTVKGSSALNCETKMVREWLRVTCRGKNDTGGTPTRVALPADPLRGTRAYELAGVTSLLLPFIDGTHVLVDFGWTDKSYTLVLDWPKGAPRPPILGEFRGAKSPLNSATFKVSEKPYLSFICKCLLNGYDGFLTKPPAGSVCSDILSPGDFDEDCARTYKGNCNKFGQCLYGSFDMTPTCRPGYRLLRTLGCRKACDTNEDCTGKLKCTDVGMDTSFCMR